MSKKAIVDSESYGEGYVVSPELFTYLQGRLFTLIEALGLKETQEKSLKDLVQNEIWVQTDNKYKCRWIPKNLHNEIRKVLKEIEEEQEKKISANLPFEPKSNYKFNITYKVE